MAHECTISRERLVGTFLELLNTNSPSFKEKKIGAVLAEKLRAAGCEVRVQDYGRSFNLIGRKKGSFEGAPPLILCAHMDTIEPTEGIRISTEGGVVRTVGETVLGADDKSALAQILEAVTALSEGGAPHGALEVVFTSAEECGLVGGHNLDFSLLRGRHALVLDTSGDIGRMVVAAPTHHTYRMKVTGRPAHAGIEPEKGLNAIVVAARIIAELPDGRMDAVTTANIGLIEGGTATNVVPKSTTIKGEARSHDPEALEALKGRIFSRAREVAASHGASLDIQEVEEYGSFRLDADDPFLAYLTGVLDGMGMRAEYIVTGGGSDANVLNGRGIRTVNVSTGMRDVHSTAEHIRVDDLCLGCLFVLRAAEGFASYRA